jgi:hypothetical protein
MEEPNASLNEQDADSSNFTDEQSMDADTIDYDGLGNDSSRGDLGFKIPPKEEQPMLDKKISNTFRWKLFVIFLVLVNTTVVVIGTSLFLENEANQEFERTVSARKDCYLPYQVT